MLRWIRALFRPRPRNDDIASLLTLLRAHGVTSYRSRSLQIDLGPLALPGAVVKAELAARPPTDMEMLYGASENELRREGLLG